MAYVVGPKGQIVVAKEHRDQLGVGPGWIAIQSVIGDHLEVYFLPPSHRQSLKATLADRLQAAFDSGRREEVSQAGPVEAITELDGVEAGSQVELFSNAETAGHSVDPSQAPASSSEASAPSPESTSVPASQPVNVTTAAEIKRGRGRSGWRR